MLVIDMDRLTKNTVDLVNIKSVTGDTREIADAYATLLKEVGCSVEKYEFIENNPTLVAKFGSSNHGRKLIFNGHMDVIPIEHDAPYIEKGKIYGRGTCDMKGSLATILEVLRAISLSDQELDGEIIIIANSLHESPGGRGEDLEALFKNIHVKADAAVVMEGATEDCTIAQMGSATFDITIAREGKPTHQLFTDETTPHPITVMGKVIEEVKRQNENVKKQIFADVGYGSYFIGKAESGEFYNQMPKYAYLTGVRRYGPAQSFEEVKKELTEILAAISAETHIDISLDMKKVRDGYAIPKDTEILQCLKKAIEKHRGITPPFVGKKLVTDAGIFVRTLEVPTVCAGPNQERAHAEIEYVEIVELEKTAKIHLDIIKQFIGFKEN